jgi:hypothetical protein
MPAIAAAANAGAAARTARREQCTVSVMVNLLI